MEYCTHITIGEETRQVRDTRVDGLQEDVDDIKDSVDGIQEDVDDIKESVDGMSLATESEIDSIFNLGEEEE